MSLQQIASEMMRTRQQVLDILSGADDRLVVVLGPPADSEPAALTELATQRQALKPKLEKELLLIVLTDDRLGTGVAFSRLPLR